MEKYFIEVKTITYQDQIIPTAVIFEKKLYLINAITAVKHNVVFYRGGIGTVYDITINQKETRLFQDKHTLKWHVYKEHGNPPSYDKDDQTRYSITSFDYLN